MTHTCTCNHRILKSLMKTQPQDVKISCDYLLKQEYIVRIYSINNYYGTMAEKKDKRLPIPCWIHRRCRAVFLPSFPLSFYSRVVFLHVLCLVSGLFIGLSLIEINFAKSFPLVHVQTMHMKEELQCNVVYLNFNYPNFD